MEQSIIIDTLETYQLGIGFFTVDILKDMVACWYAWVLMFSCQIIDYWFESFKSKYPCYKRKEYMKNMLGSITHQNSIFIIYLLEDEQELSLGMLDTSPTYL